MDNINIREIKISDSEEFVIFLNIVSDETNFLLSSSKERNLDVEKEAKIIRNIKREKKSTLFIAEFEERIIGSCGLHFNKSPKIAHRADFGISLLKDFWGKGIATRLAEHTINHAKIIDLKKIELTVRVDNERAMKLYSKLGFEIEGEIKKYFCINDQYYNAYIMGFFIQNYSKQI